ncbi:hypothetical protein ACP70R_010303 [Stipagrostis hirtigluma subsp. patula]
MGVRSRRPKRRRRATCAPDLISALGDDVLLRVLELLPDARDAVRTGALSRRWRGLWARLPALRFHSEPWPDFARLGCAERFVAFVDDALALRAAQTESAVEHLTVSLTMYPPVPPSAVEAAQGWFRYAAQHALKSFFLQLHLRPDFFAHKNKKKNKNKKKSEEERPVMVLDELLSYPKLETMRLALDGVRLKLPTAAVYASITDLSLENVEFVDGDCNLLARLLSSACCPRLQKLRLKNLRFATLGLIKPLVLEASELLELLWEEMYRGPGGLELRTPRLRVLHLVDCSSPHMLTLSSPRSLEELVFLEGQPYSIDIDGELPCVRSLNVELTSHRYNFQDDHDDDDDDNNDNDDHDDNEATIRLLQCCTSITCLNVSLFIMKKEDRADDIISGRVPHLPHVTSLKVHVFGWGLHSFGDGIADILTQCTNLKELNIQCTFYMDDELEPHFFCDHSDHWESHEISLAHLQHVECTGLAGTDCEFWFMKSLLRSALQLQNVAINFDPEYGLKNGTDAFELLPQLDGGMWTACHNSYLSYQWNRGSLIYK